MVFMHSLNEVALAESGFLTKSGGAFPRTQGNGRSGLPNGGGLHTSRRAVSQPDDDDDDVGTATAGGGDGAGSMDVDSPEPTPATAQPPTPAQAPTPQGSPPLPAQPAQPKKNVLGGDTDSPFQFAAAAAPTPDASAQTTQPPPSKADEKEAPASKTAEEGGRGELYKRQMTAEESRVMGVVEHSDSFGKKLNSRGKGALLIEQGKKPKFYTSLKALEKATSQTRSRLTQGRPFTQVGDTRFFENNMVIACDKETAARLTGDAASSNEGAKARRGDDYKAGVRPTIDRLEELRGKKKRAVLGERRLASTRGLIAKRALLKESRQQLKIRNNQRGGAGKFKDRIPAFRQRRKDALEAARDGI